MKKRVLFLLIILSCSGFSTMMMAQQKWIRVNHQPSLAFSSHFSLSVWLYKLPGQNMNLVTKYSAADNAGWGVEYFHGQVRVWLTNRYIYTSCTLDDNVWTHLVITNDGSTLKIYKNDVLIDQGASTAIVDNGSYLDIGNGNNLICTCLPSIPFQGYIEELSVFNKVLNTTEINALYTQPDLLPATATSSCRGKWSFQEGQLLQAADQSGYHHTAYLQNYSTQETTLGAANRWLTNTSNGYIALNGALPALPDTTDLADRVKYAFHYLNKSQISSGLLYDAAFEFADATLFNGQVLTAENVTDITRWRSLYATLYTASVRSTAVLPALSTINEHLEIESVSDGILIPLLYVQYEKVRDDAVSQNLLKVLDGQVFDVPARNQSPYQTHTLFAASPSEAYSRKGVVRFVFRPELFVNHSAKNVSSLWIDFDNGEGYRQAGWNQPITGAYSTAGQKKLKIRLVFTDGSSVESHSHFAIQDVASVAARYENPADVTFPVTATRSATGRLARGTVSVAFGTGNNTGQVRRPLIVVEGYDPWNVVTPNKPDENYDYEFFVDREINRVFSNNLEAVGYDLVFLDFADGTADIRDNAFLFQELLAMVNVQKDPLQQTVVMGLSMGGLVARYGLAEMASRGVATQTRLLICHDSPHWGANVPLGFQAMVRDLASMRIGDLRLQDVVPQLRGAVNLLNRPASRQLLVYTDGRAEDPFLRSATGEYHQMVNRAIPGCRVIATSQGSECGIGQYYGPYAELLKVHSNFYVNWLTWLATGVTVNAILTLVAAVPIVGPIIAGPAFVVVNAALLAVTPLVGKNWITDFSVHALPDRRVANIFHGKIQAEKRFLGLFRLFRVTVFERNRNSPATALAVDSAPGGFFDMRSIGMQLPGNPNINAFPFVSANLNVNLVAGFTFVPTGSALDTPQDAISTAALYAPYSAAQTPNASRFVNFISQERYQGQIHGQTRVLHNQAHIRFTDRNSNWLFGHIQENGQISDCSGLCSGPPAIQGPENTCTEPTPTYTVPNLTNSTYTWRVSPGLSILSGWGTSSIQVEVVNEGEPGWIEVDIVSECGVFAIRRNFASLGRFLAHPTLSGPLDATQGESVSYSIIPLTGATSYIWSVPQGWSWTYTAADHSSIQVTTGAQSGYVTVAGVNSCGQGATAGLYVAIYQQQLRMYPNPTVDKEVTIELLEAATPHTTASSHTPSSGSTSIAKVEIKLYNAYNQIVRSGKTTDEGITFSLKDIPAGNYCVVAIQEGKVFRKHIIVQH